MAKKTYTNEEIQRTANKIRKQVLKFAIERGGCYITQTNSSAETLATLYLDVMNLGESLGDPDGILFPGVPGPDNMDFPRGSLYNGPTQAPYDRFFLSPAHYACTLYCTLFAVGRISETGIERFNKIAMPALFIMLVIVIIRSVTLPGASAGLSFLFKPNFEVFAGSGWISVLAAAGGQLFFSLSIAMGILVTYGSYLDKEQNLERNSFIIPIADTLVAIMAGLAIFPAVFAEGQDPAGGVGLLYMTLQTVFNNMGGFGPFFGMLFYALVAIAAITSAMSVLEAIIGSFIDLGINKGKGNQRRKLAWGFGIATTIIGVLVACDGLGSYFPAMFGKFCWVDGFDLISEGILMPIGAFLTTIFFGWIDRDVLPNEVRLGSSFKTEKFYRFCIRFVAPLFTLLVLLGQLDSFFGFGWF